MKKTAIITAIAFLAISFLSCSKTPGVVGTKPPTSPPPPVKEVKLISDWILVSSYSVGSDRLGNSFITGIYPFTAGSQIIYDKSTHVELAYARFPSGQRNPVYAYKRLAFNLRVEIDGSPANVSLDYLVDPNGLTIYFTEAEYRFLALAVDQTLAENWKFRYIVIPKSLYQATNVDWNDLSAVASALNFSL